MLIIHSYLASVVAQCRQPEEVKGAAWKTLGLLHQMRSLGTEDII